ncbi:SPOR domain-containing protein [Ectothiorhodospira lacustris]|uniref:SPOR domain-containing protein n=1 Tax=Ectothiorhodospira lacustris TaxID=2899127 RepID=UPI001EE8D1CE|nr:SPOR domain-containing protein [Ectothiorhodospira lacustris]
METPLKQRLVGAAVLVALAVIFLPMLLDGAGREARLSLSEPVPPEPLFERPVPAPIQERRPATMAPPSPVDSPVPSTPPPQVRPQARSVPEASPPPPPPAESRSPTPVRSPDPNTPVAGGWVVQVGSFGQETNARGEADRLRQAGFPAFVERTSADGRVFYRVKVGPELERHAAQSLQVRLQDEHSLRGIVVSHP